MTVGCTDIKSVEVTVDSMLPSNMIQCRLDSASGSYESMMKISQTGGNLNEDEAIYSNQNETVYEDIYTDLETINAQTDGIDRKKQEGKLPSKYFSS